MTSGDPTPDERGPDPPTRDPRTPARIDWDLVADVFADALEMPEAERAAFVRERCAGQSAELDAVERLLAARRNAKTDFLEPIDGAQVETALTELDEPAQRIGPWRILREIGRGGMGQVYLAERDDGQFEQQVAIKLLKRGMDSDVILARFLRERQILAGLHHPNVARMLDGGVDRDDRPYFVMEHVEGEPITTFADARRLSIDARLDLFREVCDAVSYAHRNLVVHRDLKPSNILVTSDGRPILLDFGIAKLLSAEDDLADATTLTIAGARFMTPAYAAPEQIYGGPVTTSTDVYGLGAVLYELLSGLQPFDRSSDRLAMRPDAEPVTLSSALQRAAGAQRPDVAPPARIAAARGTDPARLRRRLAGDLETIVAAALRATPERRYPSVAELEEDVRRHRERLPVRARPDTLGYRVSRFIGRHRYGVAAVSVIAVLVLAFGVTARVQARALAVERDRARAEATTAREVSDFLVSVFEVSDPFVPGADNSIRAEDLLERGAERIEAELEGQPEIQARLFAVIARAFNNLRRSDRARPLMARSVELRRTTEGPVGAGVVAALQELALVESPAGDQTAAEATLREAIGIQARIEPEGVVMWSLLVDLAYVIHASGDYTRGRAAVADAMALFPGVPVDAFGERRWSLTRLANMLSFGPAENRDSVFARMVQVETLAAGAVSAPVATVLSTWAVAKSAGGDLVGADSLIRRAVRIHEELDPTSLAMAHALGDQARIAMQQGDVAAGEELARASIRIRIDRLGSDHLNVAYARAVHADALRQLGRFDESLEVRALANETLRRENDVLLPVSVAQIGATLLDAGRARESIAPFESALRMYEATYPPDYLLTANLRRDYGAALVEVGRAADAESVLQSAIDVLGARWGEDDPRVDIARISLGRALTDLGRTDEARSLLEAVVGRLAERRGAGDELTSRARAALDRIETAERLD